jgi:hypothetical protein
MLIVLGLALLAVPAGTAAAQGYGTANFIAVSDATLFRGQTFTVIGCCYSGEVTVTVFSEPLVGTTTADSSGNFSINLTIPDDFDLGAHTVTATGEALAGGPLSLSTEVVVVAATDVAGPVTAGPGDGGGLPRTGTDPVALVQFAVVLIGAGLVLCERQRRVNRQQAHVTPS